MNLYPGERRGRGSGGGQKDQERTSAGNTWNEQEDALFGPLPSTGNGGRGNSSSKSESTAGEEASAYGKLFNGSANVNVNSNSSSKSMGLKNFGSQGGKKLSAMTEQASSRISGILSHAKKSAAAAADQIDHNIRRANASAHQQRQQQQQRHASYPAEKKTKATASLNAKIEPNPLPSPLSFSFNTPSDRNQEVSRMVQNVLLSQIPMRCTCCHAIPLMYNTHPFFGSERVCSTHNLSSIPQCISCDRFQPKNQPFARIGTSSALICDACSRTAILDDIAATNIYRDVLVFLSSQGGLDMFDGKMEGIPIKVVSEDTLNQKLTRTTPGVSEQVRGLCIRSEQPLGLPSVVGMARDMFQRHKNRGSGSSSVNNNGGEEVAVRRNHMAGIRHVNIKAILCLKGLPYNLMASVLAHEATHAWFGLNPLRRDGVVGERTVFRGTREIDQTVEEGTCQLVAHLFLQYVMALDKHKQSLEGKNGREKKKRFQKLLMGDGTSGPTDEKLIQYFKWSIENHPSPVYGGGFKQAVRAYQQTVEDGGHLKDLMEYISIHRAFPPPRG